MVALRVLFVKSWVEDLEPALAVLEASGFDVSYERVDLAPALWAALDRRGWDVLVCDWKTPQLSLFAVGAIVREYAASLPLVVLDRVEDLARDVKTAVCR